MRGGEEHRRRGGKEGMSGGREKERMRAVGDSGEGRRRG